MRRYLLIFISLLSGLILYLGFRSTHTPIYKWSINLGLGSEISYFRKAMQGIHLPDWVVYSLPDGLWMFSFVLSVLCIWNFKLDKNTGPWIFSAIIFGLGFEGMQGCVKGMGVFDWNDLIVMVIGAALALRFFSNKIMTDQIINIKQSLTKPNLRPK